jgi:hypothetical protein
MPSARWRRPSWRLGASAGALLVSLSLAPAATSQPNAAGRHATGAVQFVTAVAKHGNPHGNSNGGPPPGHGNPHGNPTPAAPAGQGNPAPGPPPGHGNPTHGGPPTTHGVNPPGNSSPGPPPGHGNPTQGGPPTTHGVNPPGNSGSAPGHTKTTTPKPPTPKPPTPVQVASPPPVKVTPAKATPTVAAAPTPVPAPTPPTTTSGTPALTSFGSHPASSTQRRTVSHQHGAARARRSVAPRQGVLRFRGLANLATTASTPAAAPSAPAARRTLAARIVTPERAEIQTHGLANIPGLIGRLLPLPLPIPDWSKPIILALLVICVLLGMRNWLTGLRARRLESQRQELAADLDSMQAALVPAIPSSLGALDVSVAYRPADGPAAGGDFYDAFALDEDRVAIIVGDVSGHGRIALARAAHMHYTLRAYVEMGLDPRDALKLTGRVLKAEEDDLFTTVAIAVYDAGSATLTYATAGHPAPLLLGSDAHEPVTVCASPALGWGAPTGRRQTTVPFGEGARACFFSDGVTEAHLREDLLGRKRLAQMFAKGGPRSSASALLEDVQDRARAIHDDMAACIVEATTGAAHSDSRIEELEVDLAQLDAGHGERFLEACGVSRDQIRPAIADTRRIAAEFGAALVRVERTGHSATATASEPVALALGASADMPAKPSSAEPRQTRIQQALELPLSGAVFPLEG